mmetsp:Transcript_94140/g.271251  ORF Transcript_94140/g.271251 Transcript_94140/m.271251 type:complete len:180 (-) Transcript_94140:33-572(-)
MGDGLELDELALDDCEVTAVGCEPLARAFAGRRLARLSLRANNIGDEGCIALAGCGERLDLSAAGVGPRGLAALARQPLVALELFNSPSLGSSVGDWCAAMSPSEWPQLRHLDMSCCGLGNDGFRILCKRLLDDTAVLPKLEVLCLGGNDVDDSDEADSHDLVDRLSAARGLRVIWRNG